jgi:nitrogen regulatory protein P-II 1
MKKIEAIIRESKFEDVKNALLSIGIDSFTYDECKGVGKQKTSGRVYRGAVSSWGDINRYKLTIVVHDTDLKKTVDCILDTAYTGEIGDGKIFVSTIEDSWSIRTKENGDNSISQKQTLNYARV